MPHPTSSIGRFIVAAGLIGAVAASAAGAESNWRNLRIGDGKDWSFIGPAWLNLNSEQVLHQYLTELHLTQGKSSPTGVVIDYDWGPDVIAPPAVPFNIGIKPWNPVARAYDGQRNTNVDLMQAVNTVNAYADFEAEFQFRWGASGAAGIAAIVQSFQTDTLAPTINYDVFDPDCDLDYVPNTARSKRIDLALGNCLGFGSKSSALVLKRYS